MYSKKNIVLLFINILLFCNFSLLSAQQNNENIATCSVIDKLYEQKKIFEKELRHKDIIFQLYNNNECLPFWYSQAQGFTKVDSFLLKYKNDNTVFHYDKINTIYNELKTLYLPVNVFDYNEITDLDLLLTDASLQYTIDVTGVNNQAERQNVANRLAEALKCNEFTVFHKDLLVKSFAEVADVATPDLATLQQTNTSIVDSLVMSTPEAIADSIINEQEHSMERSTVSDSALYEILTTKVNDYQFTASLNLCKLFYQKNGHQTVWSTNTYEGLGKIQRFINEIKNAEQEGLKKESFHFTQLSKFLQQARNANNTLANFNQLFDVYLTDAALLYAHSLLYGYTNPAALELQWDVANDPVIDLGSRLSNAITNDNLDTWLQTLLPTHPQYKELKKLLANYRSYQQKGISIPQIPNTNKAIKPYTTDVRVGLLRERMAFYQPEGAFSKRLPNTIAPVGYTTLDTLAAIDSSLLKKDNNLSFKRLEDSILVLVQIKYDSIFNANYYDSLLIRGVKDFQRNCALEADGVVGRNTFAVLNESVQKRIERIENNMEYWRWLPQQLGENYLLINIPNYTLYAYEAANTLAQTKKVMVGRTYHKTPVFSDQMEYLDINPYWTVPYSIATKEILPKLKRNPGYLNKHNMQLLSGGRSVSPWKVNWASVSRRNFRYTIRQKPGDNNALGRVKFLFPNRYSIYLHDTPSKHLFVKNQRAYSHGCIRLQEPLTFASYVLRGQKKWTQEKIDKTVNKGKNTRVILEKPLPIYVLYFTTWVEADGHIRFLNDIYERE